MAFSVGEILTAANLNDLSIDSLIVDTSTLVVDKTNNRVGIGNASPEKMLQVTVADSGATPAGAHHVVFENSGDMGLLIASGTTSNGYLRFGDSDDAAAGGLNYDHNDNSFSIKVNGADRAKWNSSGHFLPAANDTYNLGASGTEWGDLYIDVVKVSNEVQAGNGSVSDPSYTFSSDGDTGIYRKTTNTLGIAVGGVEHYFNNNGLYLASGDWFRTFGTGGIYFSSYGGGLRMQNSTYIETYGNKSINVLGNIKLNAMATFSGSGYATARRKDSDGIFKELVSSERFKTDITDLSLEESEKVLDCRPILFRDKEEKAENSSSEIYAGISAESLQTAGYEWALKYDLDEDGNKTNTPRGIHYELLVTPLINIIKDLKNRIEVLEGKK